jgi:very-short-patch-repair endonuclease
MRRSTKGGVNTVYKYAVEDNIPMRKAGRAIYYTVPCCKCKMQFEMLSYIRGKDYTCSKCKREAANAKKLNENPEYLQKAYKKLECSIQRLAQQHQNMNNYQIAINKMHGYINKNGWFGSTEEMMAALVLIKDKIKLKHQYKIGRNKVDFLLPDYKIVLEIDGELYHGIENKKKDDKRDKKILGVLGSEWDVLRIKTKDVNSKAYKITDAVKRYKTLKNTLLKRTKILV